MERARTRCLCWGDAAQIAILCKEFPGGFEVILGADVLYVAQAIGPLFTSIGALLAASPEVPKPLLNNAQSPPSSFTQNSCVFTPSCMNGLVMFAAQESCARCSIPTNAQTPHQQQPPSLAQPLTPCMFCLHVACMRSAFLLVEDLERRGMTCQR